MIKYLSVADIIKINVLQIKIISPSEPIGVIDYGALDAAINQPAQVVFGKELYPTLEEKAAILVITIIKKHPFHNANKRTGFMAMDVFLRMNEKKIAFTTKEGIGFVVKIATHDANDFDRLKDWVTAEISQRIS